MTGRCGRCGDMKLLTQEGRYQQMLCDDCAVSKEYEDAAEDAKDYVIRADASAKSYRQGLKNQKQRAALRGRKP